MPSHNPFTRRAFLSATAAGSVATFTNCSRSRGVGKQKLKAGVVGCGGRGTQAIIDALTGNPGLEVVAMGDLFQDHLDLALRYVTQDPKNAAIASRVKVDPEHRFAGFDAYKKVLASDIDIVILATSPGYRPEHFEAAVEARKHIFCEKPVATDACGVRRFMAAAKKSAALKLTVVSGAHRHADSQYVETVRKIRDGAIGEVVALHSDYLASPVINVKGRDPKWGDMEWQHRNWYSFVWLCGDQIVEQHFHNIDFMNWVMGTHPVKVIATGGAAWRPREELYGNIYDHISSDFVYPNGVCLSSKCRQYPNGLLRKLVDDRVIGTKGRSNGFDMGTKGINPYVQEHINMVKSVLGEGEYLNQALTAAESTMTCIMARESAYSGMEITWDMIMKSQQDLQPKTFGYEVEMPEAPLAVPGRYKFV